MPNRSNHDQILQMVEKIVRESLDPRFTRELEKLMVEHRATRNHAPTAATRANPVKPGAWDAVVNRMTGSAA